MSSSTFAVATRGEWHHPLPLARRLALTAFIAYIALCVLLLTVQNRMIYVAANWNIPTGEAIRQAAEFHLVPWPHPTPGATEPQGFVRPDFTAPAPRGTIVVFHGNGEFAFQRSDDIDAFARRGSRTFLYEYPGFGGRPGRPSEKAIVPDAQALVRSLAESGYGPIYLWGQSLGAGVAAAACADPTLPVRGLVLASPWDTIADVGLSRFPYVPVRPLMIDKYDSITNLQHFGYPICVIRGDRDETILPRLTLNLFAHLPDPKKMILHSGYGHGDWPDDPELPWWDDALNFIAPK